MMDTNKGTYVTTNTVMSEARYNSVIRFDSDDIMLPNMVETIMTKKGDSDMFRFWLKNFGQKNNEYEACGQIWMAKAMFEEFGGYRAWVCSADSELIARTRKFIKMGGTKDVLFLRRTHATSLTRAKATNFKSGIRKHYLDFVHNVPKAVKKKEQAIIRCETNTFKEIFSKKDADVIISKTRTKKKSGFNYIGV